MKLAKDPSPMHGSTSPEVKVVRLPVIADATNAAELTREIEEALAEGFLTIVVDCTATEAIDASALHAVVIAHQVAELTIVGVGPAVARMLAVTRLDRVLRVRATVAHAIHAHDSARYLLCS